MDWKNIFFGIEGRIGRKEWWISHLVQWIGVTVAALLLVAAVGPKTDSDTFPVWAMLVIVAGYILLVWTSICINAKRWHDTDNSGWMQLIALVPVLGLWAFISNGFIRGTEGSNSYGPDPLA